MLCSHLKSGMERLVTSSGALSSKCFVAGWQSIFYSLPVTLLFWSLLAGNGCDAATERFVFSRSLLWSSWAPAQIFLKTLRSGFKTMQASSHVGFPRFRFLNLSDPWLFS